MDEDGLSKLEIIDFILCLLVYYTCIFLENISDINLYIKGVVCGLTEKAKPGTI